MLGECLCVLHRVLCGSRRVPILGVPTMRLRLRSDKHDGRLCTCCERDALYVMQMQTRGSMLITRFCQLHIEEMRVMLGHDPQQMYPKEVSDG